ncbi:RnfH family protein [Glaciecola sp. XM2]|uniref:RnfH family protein n=1 Tax=Glaciecola sp. XM2 TaxID=1914931 RepID=UPI001BDE2F48|nr:RnfH family protein [Glaciecola sp. XM2]MBT1449451.1 RnfH family protein [Glaciecola sp. XM2]
MSDQISIEVVYGLPDRQSLISLVVAPETTVEKAIVQSGVLNMYQEINLQENKVGIWNRTCKLTDVLQPGDRVEIYRPLIADPKEVRKLRAQKAKDEGRANKITGAKVDDAKGKEAT